MNRRCILVLMLLWLVLACGCAATGNLPAATPEASAPSSSVSAFQGMGSPRFFGREDAPHTILLYTNPQCPPCRTAWKTFPALLRSLDPARVKVIVTGHGFSDEGTRLMFVAAALAEQRPDAAVAFLTAVMEAGAKPYRQGWDWVENWLKDGLSAMDWDQARFRRTAGAQEAAAAYVEGMERIVRTYSLRFTPSVVINGKPYEGPHTASAIQAALDLANAMGAVNPPIP